MSDWTPPPCHCGHARNDHAVFGLSPCRICSCESCLDGCIGAPVSFFPYDKADLASKSAIYGMGHTDTTMLGLDDLLRYCRTHGLRMPLADRCAVNVEGCEVSWWPRDQWLSRPVAHPPRP